MATKKAARQADRANQLHSFMRGFKNGVGHAAPDPKFTKHADKAIRDAYDLGRTEGVHAAARMHVWAQDRYGYTPSILRSEDNANE